MKRFAKAIVFAAVAAVAVPIIVFVTLLEQFFQAGGDLFGGNLGDFESWFTTASTTTSTSTCRITVPADGSEDPPPAWTDLNASQQGHAVTIAEVGTAAGLPERGIVVALATAIQESSLRNLANDQAVPESLNYPHDDVGHDHDSIGVFQQRPSMGWGTVAQIMDPAYAAGKFYEKLLRVEDWESLSIAEAAQAVQISKYPDAYADHEDQAWWIAGWILGAGVSCEPAAGPVSAEGWTHPLPGGVFTSGYRTPERPTHDGIDLAAAKGTPVYAAADGARRLSACDVPEGYSCDEDGSTAIRGCGWYVEILHEGGVVTRYCHLESETVLRTNEAVEAGDLIGYVGNSGGSSGPHLHFEVRLGGSGSDEGEPTHPVSFMQSVGIDLY
ncbi:M23 family metallopeptidase [Glycomyces sp. MUSA5-2]|uniref:M23 family metallopeptidase n=1 Tax=Glycomyces sp. MUSA5-2 TaxID=2053002 RepID=UPI0030091B06